MSAPRRYSDDEVALIFERAAQAQVTDAGDGLSLADLQAIGRDIGLPADLVAQAAATIDAEPPAVTRQYLGTPIGVSRVVALPRRPSDDEWAHLVGLLRHTFDARGRLADHGPFRQWSNGNLSVMLEPTAEGAQLRLRTTRGGAREGLGLGLGMLVIAPLIGTVAGLSAGVEGGLMIGGWLGLSGLVMWAGNKLRQPRWAATRARQFAEVSAQFVATLRGSGDSPRALGPATHPAGPVPSA